MAKVKVEAQAGELVLDFLFKQTGQDDDLLTASFYQLNPHVRGDFFLQTTLVLVPEAVASEDLTTVTRSWD